MTEPVNPGDYRACPFCFEVIRKNAIKCRHCGSEVDPSKLYQHAERARTNPVHLVVLGILLAVVGFIAAYPTVERHLDERALTKAMIQRATAVPPAPVPAPPPVAEPEPEPEPPVVVVSPGRIEFGEGVELVAGNTYSGTTMEDLLEANALGSETLLESVITIQLGGRSYEVRTRQPHFAPDARYEIVSIEKSSRR